MNMQKLFVWLNDQLDADMSCYEDLELTEGIRNDYHRGRASAFQEMLNLLQK